MGIKPNSKNCPDIYGFEQKKDSSKITFIDKQTDEKYYKGLSLGKRPKKELKEKYWKTFERSNSTPNKIGGWKLNKWDNDGQCLKLDCEYNILIVYNYMKDKRIDKKTRVDEYYKNTKDHVIGIWKSHTLKECIERKFNQNGFYICSKNKLGEYDKICFGQKITFDYWIQEFKRGNIYYDGYSSLNGRWRGMFRASKKWWRQIITAEYS